MEGVKGRFDLGEGSTSTACDGEPSKYVSSGDGRFRRRQHPIFFATSMIELPTASHSPSALRSVFWFGPCSLGRWTKPVDNPHFCAALRSPLWAATSITWCGLRYMLSTT